MIDLQPEDPEPGPSPDIYLLPPIEHQEQRNPAMQETIRAIVDDIETLTEVREGEEEKSVFRRGRTISTPNGGTIELSKYRLYFPFYKDSPAEKLYEEELSSRVVGLEIRYPATAVEEGDVEQPIETYLVEKNEKAEYVLSTLSYDDETGFETVASVDEEDALELIELLSHLRNTY